MDDIAMLIQEKANGRKLALRWKSRGFENLLEVYGIKADIYVSSSPERFKEENTRPIEFLSGKSKEYYLVIPEWRQNPADVKRYEEMGFRNIEDVLWINHTPTDKEQENFIYGNSCINKSEGKVLFSGFGAEVKIGKNVKLPPNGICVGTGCVLEIGDNTNISSSTLTISKNNILKIGMNVWGGAERIFLNYDSRLEIGDNCTFGSGRIRTGRNQEIRIGKDCMFSWDTTLLAHDGHMIFDLDKESCVNNTDGECRSSIILGEHVWVGGETAILPNTKIGNGSICAYRSLVKGNYPNNCIIGGSIATVIKNNIAWSRDNICLDERDLKKLPVQYRCRSDLSRKGQ